MRIFKVKYGHLIPRPEPIRQIEVSFQIAIKDLGLEHLWVVYPGDQKYALDSNITAISLEEMLQRAQTGLTA
jgi:hypothetical protein